MVFVLSLAAPLIEEVVCHKCLGLLHLLRHDQTDHFLLDCINLHKKLYHQPGHQNSPRKAHHSEMPVLGNMMAKKNQLLVKLSLSVAIVLSLAVILRVTTVTGKKDKFMIA